MYYINSFFIYSVIGYILEYIMYLVCGYEGGILYGFWTPIYGVGAVIILFIYHRYLENLKKHKIIKLFLSFLVGFLILSITEYIGGVIIDLIFNKTLWDYSDYKFNIGKYAAYEMALLWGIASISIIYITRKFTDKLAKKIPRFISWILIILFIIDVICTIIFKK